MDDQVAVVLSATKTAEELPFQGHIYPLYGSLGNPSAVRLSSNKILYSFGAGSDTADGRGRWTSLANLYNQIILQKPESVKQSHGLDSQTVCCWDSRAAIASRI